MQKPVLLIFLLIMGVLPVSGQYYEGPYDPIKIHYKTPGFISINEIGYGDGLGEKSGEDYSDSFVSITTVFGYYVSQNFMFGAGTGVYFFNGGTLIPVFGDIRFTYNFKKINPYLAGAGGFLVNITDPGSNVNLFLNPMVGVRAVINYSLAATLGGGIHIQEGGSTEDRSTFINFRAGISWKPRRK